MDNEFLDKETAAEKERNVKKPKKKTSSSKRGPSAFVQILNGDFLSKDFIVSNLNFIFFLILLLLLIVGKGYYGKRLGDQIVSNQKEIDQLTTDYVESKAKLQETTQRSRLVKELETTGLKETEIPTKVIKIKKAE